MPARSLKSLSHKLADVNQQLKVLSGDDSDLTMVPFQEKLLSCNLLPLRPTTIETLQINLGKMCNQVCRHCHVDAGPDRKEIMSLTTMIQCIEVLKSNPEIKTVDLTGGAPELNPNFKWFVEEISALGRHIIVRCNLTIILANKRFHYLPDFYRTHAIEVVSSLPFYQKDRTDRQRGDGVYEDSIAALKLLNKAGYGIDGSGLVLNLVFNPAGAFLPPDQSALEKEYKTALEKDHGIYFNKLFTITNMPISRYLNYLLESGNYEKYMNKLSTAFNVSAAGNVMCRSMVSVSWDGFLYDCDFNQMLELKIQHPKNHISSFHLPEMQNREIVINQHCYGCTAGAGSSCGGAVTQS